jgi:multiple sugar transport system ATP-binding protein
MAGVRFEHVYKSFDQVEIVHDISIEIKDQEFLVENLGDELLVYLTVAGRSAVAKLDPRSQVKVGAQVRLHVDNESMHLFDTASGEAIF